MSGNTCANVFTNGKVTKVYPLPSTSSVNLTNSLQDFADDVGIPSLIHSDLAAAVEGQHTDFQKFGPPPEDEDEVHRIGLVESEPRSRA